MCPKGMVLMQPSFRWWGLVFAVTPLELPQIIRNILEHCRPDTKRQFRLPRLPFEFEKDSVSSQGTFWKPRASLALNLGHDA